MGFLHTSITTGSNTSGTRTSPARRCTQCRREWRGEREITKHFYDTVRSYCADCHVAHEAMRNDLEARSGVRAFDVPKMVRQHYGAALRLGYEKGMSGTELGHWMAADWRRYRVRASRGPRTTAQ